MNIDCKKCVPRQYGVFSELSEESLTFLNQHKCTKVYKKNEVLFRESDPAQNLFCNFSGLIKLYKTSKSGREQVVRVFKGGEILGYRAFFSGESYYATACAVTEVSVCLIPQDSFHTLCQKSPDLATKFLKKLTVELREAEEKFINYIDKSVEERLNYFLSLFIAETSSNKIDLELSREEIASLIGARSETVIRILSSWKKQGYVDFRAKSLTVLNPSFFQPN
ncbi:MAG: Crp/Fnr family transcriptional regulator [Deltaproteobacteria bacterium]|nr:Crp/Fnr family transcriptional regulator [Deltaproteobacteria bacterium]